MEEGNTDLEKDGMIAWKQFKRKRWEKNWQDAYVNQEEEFEITMGKKLHVFF